MTMDIKQCTACGLDKPVTAFTKRAGGTGRRGVCRSCLRKRKREIRLEEHESFAAVADEILADEPGQFTAGGEASLPASIAADETESAPEKPARKRKRRRKKRGKSAAKLAGAAAAPAEEDEQAAEEPVQTEREQEHESATAAASGSASDEAAGEQALPAKRKRKRGRRKRSKTAKIRSVKADMMAAEHEEEILPVRPPDRHISQIKGKFSYKTSLLNDRGKGMIRLRGRRETGKRWSTDIPTEMAVRMVEEGAAGIIHPGLIHKLYTKSDFRLLVLQRDDYICRYCGKFGDTIDHVMPKSKGGLSSPANCVCACAACNLKKADKLDFVFDEY
ncbi:HNH endonuclease [Paenibacillus silvisoli]|uniref:HNH endonuclease n=1 Tax=Paenibacillus silvisoli TaxID=3110539 RepID=UPI00280628CC|nr:HNH endonuclease [Paenibacillus silvisoli]